MLELTEMQGPSVTPEDQLGTSPVSVTPAQQLYFYDPDRWEEFIREWATGITTEYEQIKRVGGTNDRGADVAGFLTPRGFDDEWDCFQCKHYAAPLAWSDVLPELVKVFRHAADGEYVLPNKYLFLAPKGLSGTMSRLISTPHKLKAKFVADAPAKLSALGLTPAQVLTVMELAKADEFSRFGSEELPDVLDVHRATPYFATRFGVPLPQRTQHGNPPTDVDPQEARYVEQLLDVYEERWAETFVRDEVNEDTRTKTHFQRQRVRFFEAEALHAYARDSVPPGTFEHFQEAILSGVIDTVEADHQNGWARLSGALSAAGQLNLASHALIAVASQDDLKGVCHQLANDNRLTWRLP